MLLLHSILLLLLLSSGALGFSLSTTFKSVNHRPTATTTTSTKLKSIPTPIDTVTSGLASICRLPYGVTVSEKAAALGSDEKPSLKKYYWIENDFECRKVSERITELDLVVEAVVPASPKSRAVMDPGYSYVIPRDTVPPVLVVQEPGSDSEQTLVGSDAILSYFDSKYGAEDTEESSKQQALEALSVAGNYLSTFLRIGRGVDVSPSAGALAPRPAEPLVLYDYSGNQFSRLVREVLMELDLVFELRSVGKESPRRADMAKETGGSTQCPHLIDPNTQVSMSESSDIIKYLYDTYSLYAPPSELLMWASEKVLAPLKPLLSALAKLQAGSSNEDKQGFEKEIEQAMREIEQESKSAPVVVYTYELSPFSWETKALLERLNIPFNEISLGKEWFPGFIAPGGSVKRAAFLEMTGQSSLPQIFVGGEWIGGLFSGDPGLVPLLQQGDFKDKVLKASDEAVSVDPVG